MIESFKQYIVDKNLFQQSETVLLAISGGIDSMAMLHLFKSMDFTFAVAHCNFQLRGEESEEDAHFVKTSAEMLGVPFYMARFETIAYAEENKLSIQMAARELRYTWFENIRKTNGYAYIATAHNADDSTETFLINLSRGCGIDGLTGIKPKSASLIRPLLFASREQISLYTKRKGIIFREDSSNASDKYLRNFIRHNVLPVLDEAHQNYRNGIRTTIQNLISSQTLYNYLIEKEKSEIITSLNNTIYIDINKLKKLPEVTGFLWEILSTYGFNRDQCSGIASQTDSQSGKVFLSPTHRLIKDRTQFMVTRLHKNESQIFYLEPEQVPEGIPFRFSWSVEDSSTQPFIARNPAIAMLDYNLLEWPLILRKWRQGDYFAPLGMENLKKVSDFLIDQKLSLVDKENTWVLESGNKICWIVNRRIDHRFRIRETTRRILKIEILQATTQQQPEG